MNYLDVVLAARARAAGRAVRSASVRHRHIAARPLAMVFWQLGAEPFTAAAVAWGHRPDRRSMAVPGEPRDRTLAFRALSRVAEEFNPWFEYGAAGEGDLPQVVLPNAGNLAMLGRLGRRLAYLPTTGEHAASDELVRFGRHLQFLHEHARYPGQQLVLVLTDLLRTHWATELSHLETQSLPALDAAIEPPAKKSGHEAAFAAERVEIGPAPGHDDDTVLSGLLDTFNAVRAKSTDESLVAPLRGPIEAHFSARIDRAWPLVWRCLDRERQLLEGASVAERWKTDEAALGRHFSWAIASGRPLATKDSSRAAAWKLHSWEAAVAELEMNEAVDDPMRMIPALMSGRAVRGKVIAVDLENRVQGATRRIRRPLVTLETDQPLTLPSDVELYWSGAAKTAAYQIQEVLPSKKKGCTRLVLEHQTQSNVPRPASGSMATFSVYGRSPRPPLMLPDHDPWTHTAPASSAKSDDIETEGENP